MPMKNKNNLYIAIMIIAFAITGYILYGSFFKASVPAGTTSAPVQSAQPQNILPYGNQLDTGIFKTLNTKFTVFTYPKVDPNAVGISVSGLMQPAAPTTPAPQNSPAR